MLQVADDAADHSWVLEGHEDLSGAGGEPLDDVGALGQDERGGDVECGVVWRRADEEVGHFVVTVGLPWSGC